MALGAVALVAAGVWAQQRDGSALAVEVAAVESQADEISRLHAERPTAGQFASSVASQLPQRPVEASPLPGTHSAGGGIGAELTAEPSPSPQGRYSSAETGGGDGAGTAREDPGATPTTVPAGGQTFVYWDGDAPRTVTLVPADPEAPDDGADPSDPRGASGSSSADSPAGAGADRLVFRAESGIEMLLNHSVVLVLDPDWSRADVDRFLARNGIRSSDVSPMGWIPNGFTVATGPGIAPLALANALAPQDGVVLSSPNWASEFEVQ